MSLTAALQSALTGLGATQVAINVAASNITNANTEGYTRKIANLETVLLGNTNGVAGGVNVASITRRISDNVQLEVRNQSSMLAYNETIYTTVERTERLFGEPSSNLSIAGRLGNLSNLMQSLAIDPNDAVRANQLINNAVTLTSHIRDSAKTIQDLRLDVDTAIEGSIDNINNKLATIETLNRQISKLDIIGLPTGDLEDQRDLAVQSIADELDIRIFKRDHKEIVIYTSTGYRLVDNAVQNLKYDANTSVDPTVSYSEGGFNPISFEDASLASDLTSSFRNGRLKGLIELRDQILPDMASQLNNLATGLMDYINAEHNKGTAYPPPTSLTGTRKINGTDPFYASGGLRIAITDANGNYQDYIDLNLTTITQPGPTSVNTFINAINTATTSMGGVAFSTLGTASIDAATGALKLTALGGSRIAVGDANALATGTENLTGKSLGISGYFGLNDFFTSGLSIGNPTSLTAQTTVTAGQAFSGTGLVRFGVTNASGTVINSFDLNLATLPVGSTITDVVNAINSAVGLTMTATLGTDGKLRLKADNPTEAIELNLLHPPATETVTGKNFLNYFDFLDPRHVSMTMDVKSNLKDFPQQIARGALNNPVLTAPTADPVSAVTPGDSSTIQAMGDSFNANTVFRPTGNISGLTTNITNYAALFVADNARINATAKSNYEQQSNLLGELKLRQSSVSAVDIEQEMASLVQLEQAYNAAAQVVRVTSEMFDQLATILN
jgi:flagellar hook-associated protein 1